MNEPPQFTNDDAGKEKALAHGLMLSIVASTEEKAAEVMEMVNSLISELPDSTRAATIERAKVVADRLVMEWGASHPSED